VYRFASELKLSPKTISTSVDIINKAQDVEITSGKGPMGVAAAALYVATLLCNERKTQREVADVAGVTEVTIRNRYKELIEKLKLGDVEKE
jgi:transcription initiation factor TFIIB